ncbi:MAG: hypothetical protein QGH93_01585 [Gammaproteobacteria bacterium]|jgi:hypothetical protein|nr:hypothetical protein [Chromatiales bacterium]MDP6673530.1 hypothetical protein [Gammaproteobacteria bacterium]
MMLVYIVLGFLIPVVMVFAYSKWLSHKRKVVYKKMDHTIYSQLVDKCVALKSSAKSGKDNNISAEIDSVLEVVRTINDQDIKAQSLSQVMSVYVSIGCDSEAQALLSEVEGETNRANILKEVFGEET